MEQHQPVVDEKKESPSADGYIQHEPTMEPGPNSSMNGGMPPQQVYVHTAISHHHVGDLDTQFQSLGMNEIQDVSNPDGGEGDAEGEGNDEDEPLKLFVGQVRE